jgi:putative hydrolase of the HAD superfamily
MTAITESRTGTDSDLVIGFDADDTLWHNEIYYRQAAEKFKALLAPHKESAETAKILSEIEIRNVAVYGYGFKSYTLSMIEAAVRITEGRAPADIFNSVLDIGRGMLGGEVLLFEHARETLTQLSAKHALVLITKGDLLEQSSKVRRSGLAGFFRSIEIVEDKTPESYRALLEKIGVQARRFLMVGNSLKSDILPVLEIGARAVFVPYEHTWVHEHADGGGHSYYEIENLSQLPPLVAGLEVEAPPR